MSQAKTKDLTQGSPLRLMLSFMLPLLFGILFQQFYSMVDTVVVGNFIGVDALAGVGSTGSVNFLVLGLCNGICAGFAIPVAQKFGQKDYNGLRRFVGNMIWLSVLIAGIVTLVTTILCGQILTWMGTPDAVFDYAYDYIFLIFLGIPATMLYNLLSGILRSLGDSRTPLIFLILSSLLNVALDLLFILSFQMGVAGAGLATVLAQLISGLLCLGYMALKFPILHLNRYDLALHGWCVKRLLAMGLPMGMQYSITAIGSIMIQSAVNGLGPTVMAAVTAGSKVNLFLLCPFDALGSTAAVFAGQNMGAGKPERVYQGVKQIAPVGYLYSAAVLLVSYFWGDNLAMLFMNEESGENIAQIVTMSRQFLIFNGLFYIALMYVDLLRFTIQGLGFSNLAVFAGVFEMVARSVVALALVPVFQFQAVCFANASAWVLADIFLFPALSYCLKKRGFQKANGLSQTVG